MCIDFISKCSSSCWRWNRKKFWLYPLGILLLLLIPLWIVLTINIFNQWMFDRIFSILFIISVIYIHYVSFVTYIKRLHDLDKSWWMSLLLLVPLANLYLIVICWFFKWTEWKNKYWDNPLDSRYSEKKENAV